MEDRESRKRRLRELKEAAEAAGDAPAPAAAAAAAAPADAREPAEPAAPAGEPTLRFRNYAVKDSKIEHTKVGAAGVPDFAEVAVDLDAALGRDAEEALVNVAPKKANWDLRRDLAPKLARLERRTARAMAELVRREEARRAAEESGAAGGG